MRRNLNGQSGIIILDVMMALALAGTFIVIVTESAFMSREIFTEARIRDQLMDHFEANASTTEMSRLFGNEAFEIERVVSDGERDLHFISIHADNNGAPDLFSRAGQPFCAVDFSRNEVVGSYPFMNKSSVSNNSVTITPIILPINPSIPLTDLQVRNGTAYVSADSTSASDPDLNVVDIRNPEEATLYSSLSTGPGIAAISLAGKRIFGAQTSRVAQFQVVKLDGLNSPILEASYKLPLPYATATAPLASSIYYQDQKIYLGTEKWDGDEFSVIDVKDPARPAKIGGLEIGSKVNNILVHENIAYVAASDQKQLRAVDVSDPTNVREVSSFQPSGWERQEGKRITYFENSLSAGRTSGGFNIARDNELFSWATSSVMNWPSDPNMDSPLPTSLDVSGGVYGIATDRSHIYIASRQTDKEFQIFDRNLSTSSLKTFPLPVAPQSLTCDNDKLYLLAATAPVIYEIKFNK